MLLVAFGSALSACKSEQRAPEPTPSSPLELEHATRVGAAAVVDHARPAPWASTCQIHLDCPPTRPLPRCTSGLGALDADRIGSAPPVALGAQLTVRGALEVGLGEIAAIKCIADCCANTVSLSAFVRRGVTGVMLAGLGCGGDVSRTCCQIPAFGQTVVAVGKLSKADPTLARFGVYWSLDATVLCSEQ